MCLFPTKQGYPCGHCVDCLSKKRNDWSIRLQEEYNYWFNRGRHTYMALLTYDEEHVPRTSKGTRTLRQRDVQLFMKRLRKRLHKEKVFCRYFYCGEYGPSTHRPHYHILLFGLPMEWSKEKCFRYFQDAWHLGFVGYDFDIVRSEAGIHYCTKYMINKILKLKDNECEKPFTRCSKGLGMSFLFDVVEDETGLHKGSKRKDIEKRFNGAGDLDSEALWLQYRELDNDLDKLEFLRYIDKILNDRMKRGKYRSKLPRYYRDRIFDGCLRVLLNAVCYEFHWKVKEREYHEKYGDYDATHEVPMKTLIALEKEARLISDYIKQSKDKV